MLSQISWPGGQSDPISFTGQVSTANKQTLTSLLHTALGSAQIQIGFKVFGYDAVAKKYYKSFFPAADATLKGLIAKSGTSLQLTVSSAPGSAVQSPANYEMALSAAPQSIAQTLQYAIGASSQVAKAWGVKAP